MNNRYPLLSLLLFFHPSNSMAPLLIPEEEAESSKKVFPSLKERCFEYFYQVPDLLKKYPEYATLHPDFHEYAHHYAGSYLKKLLERGINQSLVQQIETMALNGFLSTHIPHLFTEIIKVWKNSYCSSQLPYLHKVLLLLVDKPAVNKADLIAGLHLAINHFVTENTQENYELALLIIQKGFNNNLSDYSHGVLMFPFLPHRQPSEIMLKFMHKLIICNIPQEVKNAALRRATHQLIAHQQKEYEPTVALLLAHGAQPVVLSRVEQQSVCHLSLQQKN